MVAARREIRTDRISELHDSILCHILSFLPTKHAATTSILSKRWKSVWLSVLTLDFDCKAFQDMASFGYSVHKLMLLRNSGLPIVSFRFNCTFLCSIHNKCDVTRFVSYVMNRGIENLIIDNDIILPPSVLSCKTLKVLKLNGILVNDFSHQVDFPVLKILHLKRMIFERHELLVKLLSGCHILEELETKYIGLLDDESHVPEEEFDDLLPSLVQAKISCDDSVIPLNLVRNVENLHLEQIVLVMCSKLPKFLNVTHLELKFCPIFWDNIWDWLLQMLEQCDKLQSLIIQEFADQDSSNCEYWEHPPIVPKCLSSQLRTCCLTCCKGAELELQFAKYILQNSKVLKTMKIKFSYYADIKAKQQMITELSSLAKGSTKCKVVF
ncbi:unnamed protein product [Lathyrus sativus]|nr:unnamed protein product [Lathyrus sativus]